LESGSDTILEAMDKKVKSKYFSEQVKICREAKLVTNTSIIIGYPQETSEIIKSTMTQLEELKVYPSTGFLLPLPETGMWKYAIENNHIKDIDHYLTQITERQDFSLNMTKMDHKQLVNETKDWLARLNKSFGDILNKDKLIKTGGEEEHTKELAKKLKKDIKIERNQTTNDSLNYGTQSGTMR